MKGQFQFFRQFAYQRLVPIRILAPQSVIDVGHLTENSSSVQGVQQCHRIGSTADSNQQRAVGVNAAAIQSEIKIF